MGENAMIGVPPAEAHSKSPMADARNDDDSIASVHVATTDGPKEYRLAPGEHLEVRHPNGNVTAVVRIDPDAKEED